VRRRDFTTGIVVSIAMPLVARAQQPKQLRVGVVMGYAESDPNVQLQVAAFREQLQKLGWVEGTNIAIDFRYAADDPERIRKTAIELLGLRPDVMVSNSNFVTTILQSEVHTIPLVFVSVSDPVGSSFVTDIARPTGNITGFANFQSTMGSKWLEMLARFAPKIENVGLMMHPEPPNFGYLDSAVAAAPQLNIKLASLAVHNGSEIENAFTMLAANPSPGLIVAPNVVTFANSGLIITSSARYQIPAIYPFAFYAKAGGLISYGFDAAEQFRQGAEYVNKLLGGAKPSDLPVQFPSKFQIAINTKTAKSLGLEIPSNLLALADDVFE
jgi:putative ABC transport system substrate-binding protein